MEYENFKNPPGGGRRFLCPFCTMVKEVSKEMIASIELYPDVMSSMVCGREEVRFCENADTVKTNRYFAAAEVIWQDLFIAEGDGLVAQNMLRGPFAQTYDEEPLYYFATNVTNPIYEQSALFGIISTFEGKPLPLPDNGKPLPLVITKKELLSSKYSVFARDEEGNARLIESNF